DGYDYDAIEADRLPSTLDFKLRADLKGQVDAWNEYADKLNHQYSKNVPNEWAEMVTREQNKKMAELNKYSSEPMYIEDSVLDTDEMPADDVINLELPPDALVFGDNSVMTFGERLK
nr:hypothetical protein [Enterococcus sp.]